MFVFLIGFIFFCLGVGIGFIIVGMFASSGKNVGTIHISRQAGKTLYTLELDDEPEALFENTKSVVFKINDRE